MNVCLSLVTFIGTTYCSPLTGPRLSTAAPLSLNYTPVNIRKEIIMIITLMDQFRIYHAINMVIQQPDFCSRTV